MPDLRTYANKRDLRRTPEPPPRARRRARGKSFVVQKHRARNLHYDFRLELDGVLLSWAVPKGPSLNPATKRLAMQTEDHPLAYRNFEGVIPKGQYGGGTVMVWDSGTWEPIGDARKGYRNGHLKFELHGEKLQGAWHLVRRGDGRSWLLLKSRDRHAVRDDRASLLSDEPTSVLTGRDLDAIAEDSNQIRLTNPDRILYEEQGLTKRDLADYYVKVAFWMLPHVEDRILTLVRCPEGRHKQCFYQKHFMPGMAAHIRKAPLREKNKTVDYVRIQDAAGLLSLVQLGVLEIHTWGAHADRPERPDQLVFDLDPGAETDYDQVVEGARSVRQRLGDLGLESFLKTSGGKGLHVVVPVQRRLDWTTTKAFCKAVADQLSADAPDKYVATMSKQKRRGRIFIDYLRNGRGATSVCAYSTRARPHAPVSTPISWEELSVNVLPDQFTVRNLPRRLSSLKHDPWANYFDVRQSITKKMRRAVGLEA